MNISRVDGTLMKAWASVEGFQPKDGPPKDGGSGRNGEVNFRGEKRTHDTHESKTDPQSKLFCKGNGKEAKLSHMRAHLLTENRNGLIISACNTEATGTAERETAEQMLRKNRQTERQRRKRPSVPTRITTPKASSPKYTTLRVTPQAAQNQSNRCSAIDGRTTRHDGYRLHQRGQKQIQEDFGIDEDGCPVPQGPLPRDSRSWTGTSSSRQPPTTWSECGAWGVAAS